MRANMRSILGLLSQYFIISVQSHELTQRPRNTKEYKREFFNWIEKFTNRNKGSPHYRLLFGHFEGGLYICYTHFICNIMRHIYGLIDKCFGFCHNHKILFLINIWNCEFWLRVCGRIKVYFLSYMIFSIILCQVVWNSAHTHATPILLRHITSHGNTIFEA